MPAAWDTKDGALEMSLLSTVRGIAQRGSPGTAGDLYHHTLPLLDGTELVLEDWRGHPALVVNTATNDGFAAQFHGLQDVYGRFRERGLLVLACPSNEFGEHELEDQAEIAPTLAERYGVEFPVTTPMAVRFEPAPFWSDIASQPGSGPPVWNFTKYLIGGDGAIRGWWSTNVRPENRRIVDAIEAALGG
jgi:glutathione peroxidase